MRLKYHIVDVFTDTPFAGNPLAVVVDADKLDPARMQAIAREFNLSETVFLLEPRDPVNTARARIFTPAAELPFAGHPTIGAAAMVARARARDMLGREDLIVVLEEEIGAIACSVRGGRRRPLGASFDIPRHPERLPGGDDIEAIARALSLPPDDIGFAGHRPGVWTAGNAFGFVPVATRDAISRARAVPALFDGAFGDATIGAFLYTPQCEREGSDIHARMFAPLYGVPEDPATGSAVAAFAGVAIAFENPQDGAHDIVIEQGFEMGRPSIIHLAVEVGGGELAAASVGGSVALVAEGTIEA